MLKEKKFRSWDYYLRRMEFWTMNDLCTHHDKNQHPSAIEEWMEFTGLKDKNGKDVYEGDIIKDSLGELSKVEWNQDLAGFEIFSFGLETYEVIGNIFENPDIL